MEINQKLEKQIKEIEEQLDRDLNELEIEYIEHVNKFQDQLDDYLKVSYELLNKATDLATSEGLCFYSNISEISQNFIALPKGKFENKISNDLLGVLFNNYGDFDDFTYDGWEHSMIC